MAALMGTWPVGWWAVLLTGQAAAVSLPLLLFRALGTGLVVLSAKEGEDSTNGPQRFQFSIRYLLGWMTALAVMLGTLKYVGFFDYVPRDSRTVWFTVIFSGSRAVIALAALWAALGTRWPAVRIIVLLLATTVAFGALWLPEVGGPGSAYFVMLYFLEALLLVGLLWVFRVAGYRLSFRSRRQARAEQ
jgi:hypothetical protein